MVSIVLPTYNERDNVTGMVEEITKFKFKKELIVVDDNSPDGTSDVVKLIAKRNKSVRLLMRTSDRGLSSAIQHGIDHARGNTIVWLDCDFSHPPEIVNSLVQKVSIEKHDIAVASRYVDGGQDRRTDQKQFLMYVHKFMSKILNVLITWLLRKEFRDWTSGFIAVKREVLQDYALKVGHGEYFISLIYDAIENGYSVIEVPYDNLPRKHGLSKTAPNLFKLFSSGIWYLTAAFKTRFGKR